MRVCVRVLVLAIADPVRTAGPGISADRMRALWSMWAPAKGGDAGTTTDERRKRRGQPVGRCDRGATTNLRVRAVRPRSPRNEPRPASGGVGVYATASQKLAQLVADLEAHVVAEKEAAAAATDDCRDSTPRLSPFERRRRRSPPPSTTTSHPRHTGESRLPEANDRR